jgi:hypothetical protein
MIPRMNNTNTGFHIARSSHLAIKTPPIIVNTTSTIAILNIRNECPPSFGLPKISLYLHNPRDSGIIMYPTKTDA